MKLKTTNARDVSEIVLKYLESNDNVYYAYSNQITHRRTTPSDPRYANQWNLDLIKAKEAWNVTNEGTDINENQIVIAVMDDGFDIDHEDIQNNLWVNPKEIIGDGIDNDLNGYPDDEHGIDLNTENGNINVDSHGTS